MRDSKALFRCSECGLLYRERKWADRCEEFCRKHKSCSLMITQHAVAENQLK